MLNKRLFFTISLLFANSGAEGAFIVNRDFLSVGHGARANAMGEAFVAVADDSSAIFWNPAGLTQLHEDEISTSYSDRFDGLATEAQLHYARRSRKAMWGFSYTGSYVTDIPVTQSLTDSDLSAIQTGTFAATDHPTHNVLDHALLISYARPLQPDSRHSVGTTVKLIYRDFLGMVRGYGTAVDLGYHYTFPSQTWRYGLNVQNVASLTSFVGTIDNLGVRATATESYLPVIKTGLAYEPTWHVLHGRLLFAFDANLLASFSTENYSAGVQYAFGKMVFLRAGKIFGRQDESRKDYSLGMGVLFKGLSFDFSFLSNELGDTARGTVSYRLGGDYYTPRRYSSAQ